MAIKFKELRKYVSRVVRISICFDDGSYDNYHLISDIPDGKYDDMYVFGVGKVDVEFPKDSYGPVINERKIRPNHYFIGCALEIVLKENDRGFERNNNVVLRFGDLRNYLELGKYISVSIKDEWVPDCYELRKHLCSDIH